MDRTRLSGVDMWSSQLRYGDPAESAEAAAELDELGFGGTVFDAVENLLAATTRTLIATGILNLWMHTPEEVSASYARLSDAHGDRFLLGIGVSHAALIDARMLSLAASRSAGAHPYLVTPSHTHQARIGLGDGPLLLPEQTVILTDDADEAREIGKTWLRAYLAMPNYANSMRRIEAGADHVCVQVLLSDPQPLRREEWRRIAGLASPAKSKYFVPASQRQRQPLSDRRANLRRWIFEALSAVTCSLCGPTRLTAEPCLQPKAKQRLFRNSTG